MEKENSRSKLLLILGIILLLVGAFIVFRHFSQGSSSNINESASSFNSYEDTGLVSGRVSQLSSGYENPENDYYYYFARVNGLDIFLETNQAFANEVEGIESLDTTNLVFTGTIKNLVYQDRDYIQGIYKEEYPDLSLNDNSPYLQYMLSNVEADTRSFVLFAAGVFSALIGLGLLGYGIFSLNKKEDEERAKIQAAIAQNFENGSVDSTGGALNLEEINTEPVSLQDDSGGYNKFFPKLQAYIEDSYFVKTSHDLRVNLQAINSINLIPVYDNNDLYSNLGDTREINGQVNDSSRIRNYELEFVYENNEREYLQLSNNLDVIRDSIKGFITFINKNYPNINLSL